MKKIYLRPAVEFEEIEGLNDLMEDMLSPYKTEGSGTAGPDNDPTDMNYEGDTPGSGTGEGEWWDPNG